MAQLNPVKHFIAITRAILLKGAGPADVAAPIGVLGIGNSPVLRVYRVLSPPI